ncbi:hypothetical protein RGUI_3167 [Rhodovulum sp. P5]|uniref:hypothetical protein n=1 Tax=Rhodovulum sp. P5 TaxID=1564506 RepID=UPI0009C376FC|nr:hypothetical protein [Rhodovulum sp. P5]ARE41308.1 hypothetical protein RGUI_3167 [Rhodovulum sp. P5]
MNLTILRTYRQFAVQSSEALEALRGCCRDEDVFILGSGPSITNTDLKRLDGKAVLLLNNAVSLLDRFSPRLAIAVVSDHLRAIELRDQITRQDIACIATTDKIQNGAVNPAIFRPPFLFVMPRITVDASGSVRVSRALGFSDDLGRGVYLGKSVVFPAIQIAHHLGAQEIRLVGIDMTLGRGVSYFDPAISSNWSAFDYAADGRPHFAAMAGMLRARGILLTNETVGGDLDVLAHLPDRLALSASGEGA